MTGPPKSPKLHFDSLPTLPRSPETFFSRVFFVSINIWALHFAERALYFFLMSSGDPEKHLCVEIKLSDPLRFPISRTVSEIADSDQNTFQTRLLGASLDSARICHSFLAARRAEGAGVVVKAVRSVSRNFLTPPRPSNEQVSTCA